MRQQNKLPMMAGSLVCASMALTACTMIPGMLSPGGAVAPLATGASVDLSESHGFTWLGKWNQATRYQENDVVESGGSAWIAIATSVGAEPSAGSPKWALLASKGDRGEAGPAGPAGAPAPTPTPGLLIASASIPVQITVSTASIQLSIPLSSIERKYVRAIVDLFYVGTGSIRVGALVAPPRVRTGNTSPVGVVVEKGANQGEYYLSAGQETMPGSHLVRFFAEGFPYVYKDVLVNVENPNIQLGSMIQ